ncbi:MAG TPA: SGNH/GDSL hydrolase family protein [Chryseolinea sp.]|jgi:lysophospholipase L1-like esterase|nr:SGNH/GDSL hydrolase family protein [Chryseolinea sp.]
MKIPLKKTALLLVLCIFKISSGLLLAQNPERFAKEVDSIVAANQSFQKDNLVLFTGSSSIRLWKDLNAAFPKHNVLNMGFGGSEMADLLYFTDKLIVPFHPKQIFIYEGDNDLSVGRTAEQIIASADSILLLVRQHLPEAEVIFISPKPSLKRWELKAKYEDFNKKLRAWTSKKRNVRFADVWTPMLDRNGNVMQDIFIADGLHLNEKGYSIWASALKKYVGPSK